MTFGARQPLNEKSNLGPITRSCNLLFQVKTRDVLTLQLCKDAAELPSKDGPMTEAPVDSSLMEVAVGTETISPVKPSVWLHVLVEVVEEVVVSKRGKQIPPFTHSDGPEHRSGGESRSARLAQL